MDIPRACLKLELLNNSHPVTSLQLVLILLYKPRFCGFYCYWLFWHEFIYGNVVVGHALGSVPSLGKNVLSKVYSRIPFFLRACFFYDINPHLENAQILYKSSHRSCSVKFRRKHRCQSLFLIKLQVRRRATLLKRYSNTGAFL